MEFQSTLLQEERLEEIGAVGKNDLFQSTLLQEERRYLLHSWQLGMKISIHAPTRGATPCFLFYFDIFQISIHAPTREATCQYRIRKLTPRISIHAPTRGATKCQNGMSWFA